MADEIETAAEAMEAGALGRAVHADADAPPSAEVGPLPAKVAKTPIAQKSPAEWAYQRLILYLKKFEETLDPEHEMAMGFTTGGAGVLRIRGLGFFPPDIVTFYGTDGAGAKTQLIQHVTQLNVTLRAMPKATDAPAQRIGFRLARDLEDDGGENPREGGDAPS